MGTKYQPKAFNFFDLGAKLTHVVLPLTHTSFFKGHHSVASQGKATIDRKPVYPSFINSLLLLSFILIIFVLREFHPYMCAMNLITSTPHSPPVALCPPKRSLITLCIACVFDHSQTLISTLHICIYMGPFTETWQAYHWPHPQRCHSLFFPSLALSLLSSQPLYP